MTSEGSLMMRLKKNKENIIPCKMTIQKLNTINKNKRVYEKPIVLKLGAPHVSFCKNNKVVNKDE